MKTQFTYAEDIKITPLRSGLYCLSQIILKNKGGVIIETTGVTKDYCKSHCLHHSEHCGISDIGSKAIFEYCDDSNNIIKSSAHIYVHFRISAKYIVFRSG